MPVDGGPAAAPGGDHDRQPGVAQTFDISGDGALGDIKRISELPVRKPATARAQLLNDEMLALNPAQHQMSITGISRLLPDGSVHASHRNHDTGLSRYPYNVAFMNTQTIAQEFFETYTNALLARDAEALAGLYTVPALIQFPQQAIAVADARQTEDFFQGAFGQYQGVSTADATVVVVAATAHSMWADVTWEYDGDVPGERNMYQLARSNGSGRLPS